MKILQISYSVNVSTSCYRLKHALEMEGHEVTILTMYAQDSIANEPGIVVITPTLLFRLFRWIYYRIYDAFFDGVYKGREPALFSVGNLNLPYRRIKKYIAKTDVVHIHWALGLLGLYNIKKTIRRGKKVIWTAHDCWPFTGGCHHSKDCILYEKNCGNCPQLCSHKEHDITYRVINKKKRLLNDSVIMIGPSKWISEKIKRSCVFRNNRVITLPNALDCDLFGICTEDEIRRTKAKYCIGDARKVLLVGAVDMSSPYKGSDEFLRIMKIISRDEYFEDAVVVSFGKKIKLFTDNKSVPVVQLGYIDSEEEMVRLYNIADVFMLTSTQENLPTVIMESMSCGTPVTAFDIGGVREMIEHKTDGYIAEPFSSDDFVKGIKWCVGNGPKIKYNMHKKMHSLYGYETVAKKHIEIYLDL